MSRILILLFIAFTEILFSLFYGGGKLRLGIRSILPKVPQLLSKALGFDPNLLDSKTYICMLTQCPPHPEQNILRINVTWDSKGT